MRKIIFKIFGQNAYLRIERWKKKILPTKYDIEQKKIFDAQLNFYSQFIKPNHLCFDIGANIGEKTALFLQLKAHVISIEPQQECINILKKRFGKRVAILKKGVGEAIGIKSFYVANNSQLSSFDDNWVNEMKEGRFKGSEIQTIEQVEITTLDNLIQTYGKPDFIKIDVEGYEKEVLTGLTQSFKYLSFEYAVPEKLHALTACLEILQKKYKNLTCNYAVGNGITTLALVKWIPIKDMIDFIQQKRFVLTDCGDIYVQAF
jgi:FkbM family methyltransferase